MEDDRRNTQNSGEKSPDMSSSDFEFGSLTPSSPSHSEHSPADYLFLNGRLLPHTFPMTRSVSSTTSQNTFRSNSTSSGSSDSSSLTPRTRTCSVFKEETSLTCFGSRSEKPRSVRSGTCVMREESYQSHHKKKPPMNNGERVNITKTNKVSYIPSQCKRKKATEIVTAQLYGPYTRRWQHITPVFKREGSVRSNGGGIKVGGREKKKTVKGKKKKRKEEERRGSKLMKWWKRVLKAVMLACRECHAMEPQRVVNYDADVKDKIIKCS